MAAFGLIRSLIMLVCCDVRLAMYVIHVLGYVARNLCHNAMNCDGRI